MKQLLTISSAATISLLTAIIPSVTSAALFKFKNPLKAEDAMGLIKSVVDQLFPLVITICVLIIIYIGFRMAVAAHSGNSTEFTNWTKNLFNALKYIAIIAGAKVIIEAVRIFGEGIK